MNPVFAWKLGLHIRKTNVRAQKINGSTLKTFEMMITNFQVEDKGNRPKFFQKIFLMADIKFEMILRMFFLKTSNADVSFGKKTLTWKSYATIKVLPITEWVQLVDPKEFVILALDTDSKIFVVHVAIWEWEKMPVHSEKQT